MFTLNTEISIGHILTLVSILVSGAAVGITVHKMRVDRRREAADRIRKSIALVIATLNRWVELSLYLVEEVQPIITQADIRLVKTQNITKVRDYFWRELVSVHAGILRRMMEEKIEVAYAELQGYRPDVQKLFTEAIHRLKHIDHDMFDAILQRTQQDIMHLPRGNSGYYSAQLGNTLREACGETVEAYSKPVADVVSEFTKEMTRLINAPDKAIVLRTVEVRPAEQVLPETPKLTRPSQVSDIVLADSSQTALVRTPFCDCLSIAMPILDRYRMHPCIVYYTSKLDTDISIAECVHTDWMSIDGKLASSSAASYEGQRLSLIKAMWDITTTLRRRTTHWGLKSLFTPNTPDGSIRDNDGGN